MRLPLRLALAVAVTLLPATTRAQGGANNQPQCQMKVVSCNYAYLYSGQFSWTNTISSSQSQFHEQVTVTINNGAGNCLGTVRETENGQTQSGTVSGQALVAVEFEPDSTGQMAYRITVACPSVAGMGSPVQPAELGHHDIETYHQRASAVAQKVVNGSSNYPAPETDSVNGVTGTVQVTWSLTRP
ncbi:MAG: hypothetical protein U0132_16970 [Gemmatimonadaceae bacterium]